MKRFNIPTRSKSEIQKGWWKNHPWKKEEARKRMLDKNDPIRSLAARKKLSEFQKGRIVPRERRVRISNTLKDNWECPCTKEFLEKIYVKKGYSTRDIQRIYGWHNSNIYRWLKRFDIPRRKPSYWHGKEECKQNFCTNPYGRGWTVQLKGKIKERDGYLCQFCKVYQGNHLVIHHVDTNKYNNSSENLVTLCMHCHGRLHRSKVYRDELSQMKFH